MCTSTPGKIKVFATISTIPEIELTEDGRVRFLLSMAEHIFSVTVTQKIFRKLSEHRYEHWYAKIFGAWGIEKNGIVEIKNPSIYIYQKQLKLPQLIKPAPYNNSTNHIHQYLAPKERNFNKADYPNAVTTTHFVHRDFPKRLHKASVSKGLHRPIYDFIQLKDGYLCTVSVSGRKTEAFASDKEQSRLLAAKVALEKIDDYAIKNSGEKLNIRKN